MRFVRVFFAATLLGLLPPGSAFAQGAGRSSLPAKENFHLFLLIGQSNMAGRGKIAAEDQTPHPRVLTFTKDDRWAPATDPLHFDKPGVVGVGLGRTFGIQIAEANPEIVVGLIPCAAGGSPISSWAPGGYHAQTKSQPYDDALRRARAALKFGELKGILWHQGESDAQLDLAEVYEEKLHELIARLRSDLGAPNAPFIAGQMGQFPERPWSDAKKQVDAAHRSLPEKVADAAFVSSEGLTHKGDEVHFNAESYRELGRRYAKAFLSATEAPADDGSPSSP
jgi:pimeloyl-ACP methyl ester carboxylesterase